VIVARLVLVAINFADRAQRGLVEPIAVTVELGLSKIFVPRDVVLLGERFGALPSFGFDTQESNIARVIFVFVQVMTELVKKGQLGASLIRVV
jgi:hypothetical protein